MALSGSARLKSAYSFVLAVSILKPVESGINRVAGPVRAGHMVLLVCPGHEHAYMQPPHVCLSAICPGLETCNNDTVSFWNSKYSEGLSILKNA
jgi:hypothetical protein